MLILYFIQLQTVRDFISKQEDLNKTFKDMVTSLEDLEKKMEKLKSKLMLLCSFSLPNLKCEHCHSVD